GIRAGLRGAQATVARPDIRIGPRNGAAGFRPGRGAADERRTAGRGLLAANRAQRPRPRREARATRCRGFSGGPSDNADTAPALPHNGHPQQ
ncbi:hypothetical protein CEJ63_25845, partial [Acinetobacter baumannii]